jgi:hypothetical protein
MEIPCHTTECTMLEKTKELLLKEQIETEKHCGPELQNFCD